MTAKIIWFRALLLPFTLPFALIIFLRNFLYQKEFLKRVRFEIPIIAIGNLAVGGTGKTPHIEYLIRLLGQDYQLSILSRGYMRQSKGFIIANEQSTALQIGDEPLLLKKKYPHTTICVSENRVLAIPQLLSEHPKTQVVLMDDGLQHLSILPGLSILLTTYQNPYFDDALLPAGRLREFSSGASRADFIVITKCPFEVSEAKKTDFINRIRPLPHQKIFFSHLRYSQPYSLLNPNEKLVLNKTMDIYVFCGIANPDTLEAYIKSQTNRCWIRAFDDHHFFDRYDLEIILETFKNIESQNKFLITTEKDAARLLQHKKWIVENQIQIFALPVSIFFQSQEQAIFDHEILTYLNRTLQNH